MNRRPVVVGLAAAAVAALLASAGCSGDRPVGAFPAPSENTASPAAHSSPPAPSPPPPASPSTAAPEPDMPPGITAGIAVFDRRTGSFTVQRNATMRFRSASLVKLLIALDHLWNLGPGYTLAAADRSRFDLMLRSSDDDAASYFYRRNGSAAVVTRMVRRLGLRNTTPPSGGRTGWGSTALSAADIVRVYRYVLDTAPAPVRDLIMGDLRQSTRCGTDGFDQSFGIPSAFGKPWAAKQGWYEFAGTAPGRGCTRPAAATGDGVLVPVAAPGPDGVDWAGEVLHTTGVVGEDNRTIVVVLTLHRHGTSFASASAAVTRLTRSLPT